MKALRHAFAAAKLPGELGEQVEQALSRTSKRVHKERPRARQTTKDKLQQLQKEGVGDLLPCNFLSWRPGTPARVGKHSCRILFGLVGPETQKVVIAYDKGNGRPAHAAVDVQKLQPCTCGGYIHTRECKPQ